MSSGPCLANDPTLNLAYGPAGLTATPIISPASDNALTCRASGLYVPQTAGYSARFANQAGQSIPTGTATTLTFDTTRYELWTPTQRSGGNVTIPQTGSYIVGYAVNWGSSLTGYRAVQVRVNSGLPVAADALAGVAALSDQFISAEGILTLQQGDVVSLLALQNSAGAISIQAGGPANWTNFDFWVAAVNLG